MEFWVDGFIFFPSSQYCSCCKKFTQTRWHDSTELSLTYGSGSWKSTVGLTSLHARPGRALRLAEAWGGFISLPFSPCGTRGLTHPLSMLHWVFTAVSWFSNLCLLMSSIVEISGPAG
jgi:hypothetical protein